MIDEIREDGDKEMPTLAYLVANRTDRVYVCWTICLLRFLSFFLQYPMQLILAFIRCEMVDLELLHVFF